MAGFTQVPDYQFLKGAELTQIAVSRYTVDFRFTDGQSINLGTEFDHFDAREEVTSRYDIEGDIKAFTVHWLLNLRTTDAEIISDDALRLTFENGDTVTFLRRNDGHESMTIWGDPGGVIVIE